MKPILRPTLALAFAFVFSFQSASFASDAAYYCESGNPNGGGPVVEIETYGEAFKITVSYNRHDLDSSNRSETFRFYGKPTTSAVVNEQGAECLKSTFRKRNSRKIIDFTWCEADSFGSMNLANFTKLNSDFTLGCN
jgi:hypothetical protein